MPPHVKDLPLNTSSDSVGVNGGGRTHKFDITNTDPEIQAIFHNEAINSDHGKQIVARQPLDELRAVQGYLDHQTNIRDRPGLFVWLNERAFGAELLAGRARTMERQPESPHVRAAQRQRQRCTHTTQEEQHIRHDQYDACCSSCGEHSVFLCTPNDPFCDQCGVRPGDNLDTDDGLTPDPELWQAILSRVDIAQAGCDVWLAPAMIAHYQDFLVLTCPHKLVRDMIRMCYLDHIAIAAADVLGHSVVIETAVKHMFTISEQQQTAWLHAQKEHAVCADDARHDEREHAAAGSAANEEQETRTYDGVRSVVDDVNSHATSMQVGEEHKRATYQRVEKLQPTRSNAAALVECVQDTRNAPSDTANTPRGIPRIESFSASAPVPLPPPLNALWHTVLQQIAVPQSEWRIWLEPTYLLQLDDAFAMVGTPNRFVRDKVANCYQGQLEAALTTVIGRPIRIEIVTANNAAKQRDDYLVSAY